MYQDLIIILGIIFLIYKLITHEGKLSMARVIATFSIIVGCGLVLLSKLISPFVLLFWWLICIGISLIGMYFVPSSENYDEDKTQKHQKLYRGALYSWIFMIALYVNDTLRMYKNDDIRMYNFDCITDTIVEVITTCNTYTLLTVHLL